ncbi:hypothetical protein RFI_31150, partial [Reticulomyxa filosa]
MDGFDEIYDFYRKNKNEKYFYDRFNLNQWNAKVIVTCRSKVLSDGDIQNSLIDVNHNSTSIMYLWPFTKQQMHNYIEKFVNMQSKNIKKGNNSNWTSQQYKETLDSYPNLQRMIEEPFLLQLILTVLPSLVKQYGIGSKITKAQVYEVFNDQWIDIHSQNVISKLAELRIQMNINKIKLTLKRYCLDLGLDMFRQGNQVAVESEFQEANNDEKMWSELDPKIVNYNKIVNKKTKTKTINKTPVNTSAQVVITQNDWDRYFNGDSIAKCVLRRVGDNKYQFLHKSCQEYYAAQKIILDIISWKPNVVNISDQQFQQEFETHVPNLFINHKLLNEEFEIIQFIVDRIYDNNSIFVNLKSRLFRIIESSKNNPNVSIAAANAATILNVARVGMSYQNWDKVNISHAILDHAFLEGTSFKEAILDGVSFINACLNFTNFTKASVNQVNFGEYGFLKGHEDVVTSVRFSPDGNIIASGSIDKTIQLWDVSSGEKIQMLVGHSEGVSCVAFSPDGTKLASGSGDSTIGLWNIISGKRIGTLEGHSDLIGFLQFSSDGTKLLSASLDSTIHLWNVASNKSYTKGVCSAQFSPDNTIIIASCSLDKTIQLWDALSGEQLYAIEDLPDAPNRIHFSPDGATIVSGLSDNTIRIWSVISGEQMQCFEGHLD